jgi:DNA-binding CsgD family transcriptional regulator
MLPSLDYEIIAAVATLDALESLLEGNDADVILIDSPDGKARAFMAQGGPDRMVGRPPLILLEPDAAGRPSQPASGVAARGSSLARFAAVLPNHISGEQLRAAIGAAAAGLSVSLPEGPAFSAAPVLPSSEPSGAAALGEPVEPLTPRERQVLQMLASGLANKEIAAKLNISEHTAKFHVAAILGKLGAGTRTEAVTMAIRAGLVLL